MIRAKAPTFVTPGVSGGKKLVVNGLEHPLAGLLEKSLKKDPQVTLLGVRRFGS